MYIADCCVTLSNRSFNRLVNNSFKRNLPIDDLDRTELTAGGR